MPLSLHQGQSPGLPARRRAGKCSCARAPVPFFPQPLLLAGSSQERGAWSRPSKVNGRAGPRYGPTLFQVQEQLGHAGRRVLLPALGLRRGAALRQPVAVGRVARGPPQRLQGFGLSFAPFGGGRFACGRLALRGLRCGRIEQRWAWR